MATRLKDTDVVVVGLGAAGGVAVLPLVQAGINVIGLEAGTWLTKRDFAPDELRNNVRDWPMAVQKAQQEVPTHRANAKANTTRAGSHPMMNAVGGTRCIISAKLAQCGDLKVVSEVTKRATARRGCRKDRPSKTGRSASTSSSSITTRSNTNAASGAGRQHQRTIDHAARSRPAQTVPV